nr:hypothetical protein CFP56_70213 [Quercus suber]
MRDFVENSTAGADQVILVTFAIATAASDDINGKFRPPFSQRFRSEPDQLFLGHGNSPMVHNINRASFRTVAKHLCVSENGDHRTFRAGVPDSGLCTVCPKRGYAPFAISRTDESAPVVHVRIFCLAPVHGSRTTDFQSDTPCPTSRHLACNFCHDARKTGSSLNVCHGAAQDTCKCS